jgi:DNA-directed RNA polymerase subunit RPC12/RpoP
VSREGPLFIDLAGITRITSIGVKILVEVFSQLSEKTRGKYRVTLEKCSIPLIQQINMVSNLVGKAEIASFYAPYRCDNCHREVEILLSPASGLPTTVLSEAPNVLCSNCGNRLQFDDIPTDYFSFLRRDSH